MKIVKPENAQEVDVKYVGKCMIVCESYYYNGYSPIDFVEDEHCTPWVFENYDAAKEWIENATKGVYYLEHGEAGAPDYTIVAA